MTLNNTSHPADEEFVEHFYALRAAVGAVETSLVGVHLASCEVCRASFAAIARLLAAIDAAPVPERGLAYGREVWQRLQPQMRPRLGVPSGFSWRAWFVPRRLALVGAMAALIIVAFLAGRLTRLPGSATRTSRGESVSAIPREQGRERILLVAVGDHLDRSQMVLVELINAKPGTALDISTERRRAEDLVAANRLYRQTAERVGDTGMASVLDELERVLVEIANSPQKLSSPQLASLRKRIESRGILFKIRVVDTEIHGRAKAAQRGPVTRKTS
jgi:hypothetical protein